MAANIFLCSLTIRSHYYCLPISLHNSQQAAHHESEHAIALAVRTGLLPGSIYVGCNSDGSCASGIVGNPSFPANVGTCEDWIIHYLAGYASERRLDAKSANRNRAVTDDIVVEQFLRACYPNWTAQLYERFENDTVRLIENYWVCIHKMAMAVLAETPVETVLYGSPRHIYRLDTSRIEQILTSCTITTCRRFPSSFNDADFIAFLNRQHSYLQVVGSTPILEKEFYNIRRFTETKRHNTLEIIDYKWWLDLHKNVKIMIDRE